MRRDQQSRPIVAAALHPRQTVLWIIAILLAIVATALLIRPRGGMAIPSAFGDAPMAGARGIFAFTGPLDRNRTGLWMMDVDAGNIWVYEYVAATQKLRLVAARSFVFDRYLEDYNCDEPSLEQVKLLLDRERRAKNRNGGFGGTAGSEEVDGPAVGVHLPTVPLHEKKNAGPERGTRTVPEHPEDKP
ncbi:MAG: hypothetical protein ACE5F9_05055 [Phycisphaerae bacterium]